MTRTTPRARQRGSAMAEFTIAGIAAITLLISTIQIGLLMWNYHTLAEAVAETNRYVASHGRSCTNGGHNCAITVGNIAAKLKDNAIGLPDSQLQMTLAVQSGATYTCNPLSTCLNDTTQWPPVAHLDNAPGNPTKLTAKISLTPAIISMWFGQSTTRISSVTLPATSNIPIVF